jgi:hypothetical protein
MFKVIMIMLCPNNSCTTLAWRLIARKSFAAVSDHVCASILRLASSWRVFHNVEERMQEADSVPPNLTRI